MNFITSKEYAEKWCLTERTVRNYCTKGKIAGAYLSGKTWMIPENAKKPAKEEKPNAVLYELVNFLDHSPVNYFAVENVADLLLKNGYTEYQENEKIAAKPGYKFFIRRNNSTLAAFSVGKNVAASHSPFHVIASHSDSPCFKIKPVSDSVTANYHKVNVEPYGGMIASTWLDRPLGVAGRVIYKKDGQIVTVLLNIDEDILLIPNQCIHFNPTANAGYAYNMAVDMQPFYGIGLSDKPFLSMLAGRIHAKAEDILSFDLCLVNRQKAVIWGEKNEFISSPRLDDLECVFTSCKAFYDSDNPDAINVLYITDNEEVGSSSRQGADSDFLSLLLNRVTDSLGFTDEDLYRNLASSFLISADNAHAVHPNFPNLTDSDNRCEMNRGIAIKFNASQRYTSDAVSASVFEEICHKANVPYQFFTNRSDKRGGSTLGNILINHVSLLSVDIGLPQLAMHSSFETAGADDVNSAYLAFKAFYSSQIEISKNKIEIK